MARGAGPRCLSCGYIMSITDSTAADVGLTSFERQFLMCANCGDLDSQFVLVTPATANSATSEIGYHTVVIQAQHAEPDSIYDQDSVAGARPLAGFDDLISEDFGGEAVAVSRQPETESSEVPLQPPNSERAENLGSSQTFAEVLQNYMAKWRHVHKTS